MYITGSIDGVPDFHTQLKSVIESLSQSTDAKDAQALDIRYAPAEFDFPAKKPTKEYPSFDGVFRSNWIQKHHDMIPSVVIVLTTFNGDWNSSEWMKREGALNERFARLRSSINSRDGKTILFAIRKGNDSQLEREIIDEHIIQLKRHLQLDSKTLLTFSAAEVGVHNASIKRFYKLLRDSSTAYYNTQSRKARNAEKAVGVQPGYDHLLNARCSFKVSFFFEFLGQKHQALKYYNRCFRELINSINAVPAVYTDQIKYLADYANFKICNMYMKERQVREAFDQFRAHMGCFAKMPSDMPWRHHAWVSDQYIVFAQLLEKHNISDPIPENDRSFFFQNAARYATKRQTAFTHIRNASVGGQSVNDQIEARFRGMIITAPKYLGSMPQLVDPVLDQQPDDNAQEAQDLMRKYMEEQESAVDHTALVLALLQQAHERVDTANTRRRALLQERVADLHIQEGQFELALRFLTPAAEQLVSEGWVNIAIPVLRKKMACAVYLGHLKDYLLTAINLYIIGIKDHLVANEQEELHKDVMAVLSSVGLQSGGTQVMEQLSGHVPTSFSSNKHSNKFALGGRVAALHSLGLADSQFGMFAPSELLPEHSLPNNFISEMTDGATLFSVDVSYGSNTVELGQTLRVKLSVTSMFFDTVTFGKMSLHFTNKLLQKSFTHEVESHSLIFPSKVPVVFEFDLTVPESALDRDSSKEENEAHINDKEKEKNKKKKGSGDTMVALERVEFVLQYPGSVTGTADKLPPPPGSKAGDHTMRHFIFSVCTFSKSFKKARESFAIGFDMREVIRFVGRKKSPPVFQIVHPTAAICMLSPREMTLLQGPIQRLHLVFKVGDSSLLNGKMHLSSDYTPKDPTGALFWYPDVSSSLFTALSSSESDVDAVPFHPLACNDSMQPAKPIPLSEQINGSYFYFPLFVRSDQQNTVKIKALLEFTPNKDFAVSVSKEFEIKITFQKAMELRFTFTSLRDAQSGVQKDGNHTVALRGDVINVAASLRCLHALGGRVRVTGMLLQTSDFPNDLKDSASSGNDTFRIYGEGSDYNVLVESGDETVDLTKDEVYVGNVDIDCLAKQQSGAAVKPFMASMGSMFITWKIVDPTFLQPLDVQSYIHKIEQTDASLCEVDLGVSSTHTNDDVHTDSQALVDTLTWLPSLNSDDDKDTCMIEKSTEFTRTCAMLFAVPPVMVRARVQIVVHVVMYMYMYI